MRGEFQWKNILSQLIRNLSKRRLNMQAAANVRHPASPLVKRLVR